MSRGEPVHATGLCWWSQAQSQLQKGDEAAFSWVEKNSSVSSEKRKQNLNKDPSKRKGLGPSRSDGRLAGPLPTLLPCSVGQGLLLLSCSLQELDLGWGSSSLSGPACSWGWGWG